MRGFGEYRAVEVEPCADSCVALWLTREGQGFGVISVRCAVCVMQSESLGGFESRC